MTKTGATNSTYIGHINIQPHLLAFLQGKEALQPGEPVNLLSETVAAMHLRSLLTTKTAIQDDKRHTVPLDYTARLDYVAPGYNSRQMQVFLTPTRIISFNSFLHKWMMATLFERVELLTTVAGLREKTVLEGFVEEFGMFEHVNVESLKRAMTRRRERLGILPLVVKTNTKILRNSLHANVRGRNSPYLTGK